MDWSKKAKQNTMPDFPHIFLPKQYNIMQILNDPLNK